MVSFWSVSNSEQISRRTICIIWTHSSTGDKNKVFTVETQCECPSWHSAATRWASILRSAICCLFLFTSLLQPLIRLLCSSFVMIGLLLLLKIFVQWYLIWRDDIFRIPFHVQNHENDRFMVNENGSKQLCYIVVKVRGNPSSLLLQLLHNNFRAMYLFTEKTDTYSLIIQLNYLFRLLIKSTVTPVCNWSLFLNHVTAVSVP